MCRSVVYEPFSPEILQAGAVNGVKLWGQSHKEGTLTNAFRRVRKLRVRLFFVSPLHAQLHAVFGRFISISGWGMLMMMMSRCLMSSDVSWHIRDKLWPMPKHGSIISLRPRKPEGSLGRTAQDVHLDSHTAPELWGGCCYAKNL